MRQHGLLACSEQGLQEEEMMLCLALELLLLQVAHRVCVCVLRFDRAAHSHGMSSARKAGLHTPCLCC